MEAWPQGEGVEAPSHPGSGKGHASSYHSPSRESHAEKERPCSDLNASTCHHPISTGCPGSPPSGLSSCAASSAFLRCRIGTLEPIATPSDTTARVDWRFDDLPDLEAPASFAPHACPPRFGNWSEWHMYPDGSLDPEVVTSASWGLVLVLGDSQGYAYGGFLSASWDTSARIPLPGHPDSTDCELLGIVWALVAIITRPNPPSAHIWSDSLNAVDFLEGRSRSKINDGIARLAFCLLQKARTITSVKLSHVHGHESHPWNTLADHVAKGTMKRTNQGLFLSPRSRGPDRL